MTTSSGAVPVCFPFTGDTVGGSHLSLLSLLPALEGRRWRPVIVVHEDGPLSALLHQRGLSYVRLPLPTYAGRQNRIDRQLGAVLRCLGPLRRFVQATNVKLVHTQDGRMHATWALPTRSIGAGFIWHQRTAFSPSRLASLMLRLSHRIVCNSKWTAASLPASGRDKTTVIENPVEVKASDAEVARARTVMLRAAGLPAAAKIVASVSNLRAVKRPLCFVETAIALSKQVREPLCFAVFGVDREGYVPPMRALAAQAGIEPQFLFMGFRDPIAPWIAASDLLLATSAGDAFGRTVAEAMLLGTPVIATDAGGHTEVVEHRKTGMLTPVDSPKAMAEAAASILTNPDSCTQMIESARETAKARFSINAHAARISDVYEQVLGS